MHDLANSLPVDIIQLVVDTCSRHTRRTLLSVSTAFHDVAFRSLFSQISLVCGVKYQLDESNVMGDERTREILDYLSGRPAFASVVRTLTVRWHQFGSEEEESRMCGALVGALKALPQLETFCWYGHRAIQTARLPDSIIEALPSNLQMFRATISQRFPQHFVLPSPNTQLALILADLDGQDEIGDQSGEVQIQRLFDSNAASLRELVVHCTLPVNSPLPALESLTAYLPYRPGIQNIFDHSSRLTSLSLDAIFEGAEAVFAAMKAAPDAFPHLTSFHLTVVTADYLFCATIAAFLRPKKLLRRLFVNAEQQLDEALPVLAELPCLEVLSFGCITWENHELYREYLPSRLTTLYMHTRLNTVMTGDALEVVLALIRKLPALRTLQLEDLPSTIHPRLRNSVHPSLELLFLEEIRGDIICQGSARPATLCAHRESIDRFRPGECPLIDDWLWLVQLRTANLWLVWFQLQECKSCARGTTNWTCDLKDRFDLALFEGIHHRVQFLSRSIY